MPNVAQFGGRGDCNEAGRPRPDEVLAQLDRILAHPFFRNSERLTRFLRFVVQGSLSARAELKEYVIGVEVFGLDSTYYPQVNPIVRVMAGRLRSRLAEYYLGPGCSDPIIIQIPKGAYAANFERRTVTAAQAPRPIVGSKRCVGREEVLTRLWSALTADPIGDALWVLSGDSGMGKTTTGEAFLETVAARDPGARIGRGSGSERLGESDAYVPILDCLHRLLRGNAGGHVAALMKCRAPTWHSQIVDSADSGEAPAKRGASLQRMRREIVDFFRELSASGRVVLFLDDMQWADVSTCELVGHFGVNLGGSPILCLMAYRQTAVGAHNPFVRLKLELERRGVCRDLPLPFLTAAEIREYLAGRFPDNRFPPEFAEIIHQRTQGNPMFMASMIRFLEDRGALFHDDGAWMVDGSIAEAAKQVPASVSALIRLKMEQLNRKDLKLLIGASVQGLEFDSAVVARAFSWPQAAVEERLRHIETAHNLVRLIDEREFANRLRSVRCQFVHAYYQDALYSAIGPARRAEYSLEIARALVEVTDATSRNAAAAAVLFETGRDFLNAAEYFRHAGRNAARVSAYPEAASLCERGLRALESVPESRGRDERELGLLLVLGLALMTTRGYGWPEVVKVHRRALELCNRLNDSQRLVPVLWALHTCEVNSANLGPSLGLARQMRALAEAPGGAPAIVPSLHAIGTTLAFMGRLAEGREALERIFAIEPLNAQRARPSAYLMDPRVTSLSMLARVRALMGDVDQALQTAAESAAFAERISHPQSAAYAEFWLGWLHHTRGDYEAALRHLDSAMALSGEHGLATILEWARVVRGSAMTLRGDVQEGIRAMRKSIETQQAIGSFLERSYCLTLLAEALTAGGSHEQALALCDEALAFGARTEGRAFEPETLRVRGEIMLARSGRAEAESARVELERSIALARERACRLLELRAAMSYFRAGTLGSGMAAGQVLGHAIRSLEDQSDWPLLARARRILRAGRFETPTRRVEAPYPDLAKA